MGDLPRGMLLNNPCNIRITSAHWLGKIEPSSDPDFEEFDNVEHGLRAGAKIFCNYNIIDGLSTVAQFVQRWAPPSDSNPTSNYIDFVANYCGVDSNNIYNVLDPSLLGKLLGAIVQFEQGGSQYVTPDQISTGVAEALGQDHTS